MGWGFSQGAQQQAFCPFPKLHRLPGSSNLTFWSWAVDVFAYLSKIPNCRQKSQGLMPRLAWQQPLLPKAPLPPVKPAPRVQGYLLSRACIWFWFCRLGNCKVEG